MPKLPILVRRPYAFGIALDWIANKQCLHVDAYLWEYDGGLYLEAVTSLGGTKELGAQWYALADGLDPAPVTVRGMDGVNPVTLGVRLCNRFPWLSSYQWSHIVPLVNAVTRAARRRSVQYHYIAPTMVNDPCEGILNYYSLTGREGRDAAHKARMLNRG